MERRIERIEQEIEVLKGKIDVANLGLFKERDELIKKKDAKSESIFTQNYKETVLKDNKDSRPNEDKVRETVSNSKKNSKSQVETTKAYCLLI